MITDFAQRLFQELQQHLPKDSEWLPKRELHIALQTALSKLNLVTREEFDAQQAVLQKTREKLDQLEILLAQWEQQGSK